MKQLIFCLTKFRYLQTEIKRVFFVFKNNYRKKLNNYNEKQNCINKKRNRLFNKKASTFGRNCQ